MGIRSLLEICPNECACGSVFFQDLSVSRWIIGINEPQSILESENVPENHHPNAVHHGNEVPNNIEVFYATCIIQDSTVVSQLIGNLSVNLEALILLSSNEDVNITCEFYVIYHIFIQISKINFSIIKPPETSNITEDSRDPLESSRKTNSNNR